MYRQASAEVRAEYDESLHNLKTEIEKVDHEIFGKLQILFLEAIYQKIQNK